MLLSMTVASIWVYYYMTKLDVNPSPISKLDDMLLFLCIPFFLLYCIMNLVAAFDQKSDDHIPNLSSSIATNMLMVCVAIMNFIIFLFKTKHTTLKSEKSAIFGMSCTESHTQHFLKYFQMVRGFKKGLYFFTIFPTLEHCAHTYSKILFTPLSPLQFQEL